MVITSKDNPKIKQLAKLYASRKYRRETGLFVIEGLRGCVDAVRDDVVHGGLLKVDGVYYTENAFDSAEGFGEVLEKIPDSRRFVITREIADRISDTDSCQGVFVTAKRLDKALSAEALKAGGKYLVLDELQDPGNLGTMIRTADAVGLDGVVLSGNCVDLYNPKTVRSAVGSMPRVDIFVEKDFAAFLGKLQNPLKDEFYIPFVIDDMIHAGEARVKVLPTDEQWYGVTYKEDMPAFRAAFESNAAQDNSINVVSSVSHIIQ